MGYLLHQGATVACAHQGRAQPMVADTKVAVGGQGVVVQSTSYTVAGCTQPSPPNGNGPCATAQFTTAATKILISGQPVLLSDSQATCTPTGTPLTIQATQTAVTGR